MRGRTGGKVEPGRGARNDGCALDPAGSPCDLPDGTCTMPHPLRRPAMTKPIMYHIPVCPFSQRVEILLALKGLRDAVE